MPKDKPRRIGPRFRGDDGEVTELRRSLATSCCESLLLRLRGVSTLQRVSAVALLAGLLVTVASDKYFDRIGTILHLSEDYNWSGKSETGRM